MNTSTSTLYLRLAQSFVWKAFSEICWDSNHFNSDVVQHMYMMSTSNCSQLGIVTTSNKRAEKVSDMTGNPRKHTEVKYAFLKGADYFHSASQS